MNTANYPNFELKQYTPEHIKSCAKLFFDVFTDEPFNYQITENNMLRYLTDISNTPNFRGYMYFTEDRLIGMCFGCLIDYFTGLSYDIKEIAVAKDCQGIGAGAAFLHAIEDDLAKINVEAVTLATQKGIPAFKFYEKNGYSASGSTVYMSKRL